MDKYTELLIGSGHDLKKKLAVKSRLEWENLTTLDMNPDVNPDVIWEWRIALPFDNKTFNEIHLYDVLEHVGKQGDFKTFFEQFGELWRILKPGGLLFIIVPNYTSMWACGDPGHTRCFSVGTFIFLDQEEYKKQQGVSPMSDYRHWWKKDFERLLVQETEDKEKLTVILRKRG